MDIDLNFQFPVGIRWCSDSKRQYDNPSDRPDFQFPVGIRWCSDGKENEN